MVARCYARASWLKQVFTVLCGVPVALGQTWTRITVKNMTHLGPQLTPDVTYVSRDGGFSVLVNGAIVWLYDDTECMSFEGTQLSFVSNTAAFADQSNTNVSLVQDFGVEMVGEDQYGRKEYAILANTTVGTGGWIPFQQDELEFNKKMQGRERVAIWPGTSPTPFSTTEALVFAPLVYVDATPQDPSKEYQARGMTLVSITAPESGPVAVRQGDLIIPGTQVAFGGFAALLGYPSIDAPDKTDSNECDLYLLGMTSAGLQLARVNINDLTTYSKYTFFQPLNLNFTETPPDPNLTKHEQIYLAGTFSSGGVFYSPYFVTFIMVYFNKMTDSTFYIRYLDLNTPLSSDAVWIRGGKNGGGIVQEDAEALVKYAWSPEQMLYKSPPGPGGFNYAGTPHPEFFNRQYFARSLYPDTTPVAQKRNAWYGSDLVPEAGAGGDGRHLLLSWTSQLHGGLDTGIYQIRLAMVEFGDIPTPPSSSVSNSTGMPGTPTASPSSKASGKPQKPEKGGENMISGHGEMLSSFLGYGKRQRYGCRVLVCELVLLGGIVGLVAVVF